jgi:hypothetical protein
VEAVPTPDKISRLNHYFRKISILNGKKPANIAGFGWCGKMARAPAGFQGSFAIRERMVTKSQFSDGEMGRRWESIS